MKNYREYAKENGHSDQEIEKMVGGLFGADAEMNNVTYFEGYAQYKMGNDYLLNVNYSTFDTVYLVDDDGTVLEEWELQY